MIQIVDVPGFTPSSEMRKHFEEKVKKSAHLRGNTPLGGLEINGELVKYMDGDTDTLWIGFAMGFRAAERIAKEIV